MKTILYPPVLDWTYLFQRPQQVMKQFAKDGWTAIFCNQTQVKGRKPDLIAPNLYICHDFESLKGKHVDVLYATWAGHHDLVTKGHIIPRAFLYDCVDEFPEWEPMHQAMMESCDIITATAERLYHKCKLSGKPTYLVRNGCEGETLVDTGVPAEIAKMQGPVVGFIGAIAYWLDYDIIDRVAKEFNTILVGPDYGHHYTPPRGSKAVRTGQKLYEELGAYYHHIDVGIMPFDMKCSVAINSNPVKMYEYMAAGKPCVSSLLPETVNDPEVLLTASSPEEFVAKIHEALAMDTSHIKEYSLRHEWSERYKVMNQAIESFLQGKEE